MALVLGFLLILSFSFPLAASQNNWLEGWTYRRMLKVVWQKDNFPVPPVAVFEFSGPASIDGRDIRIVGQDNQSCPCWVVSVRQENSYQVAFSPQEEKYFLYYGNPSAPQQEVVFQPQRGLILEVYPRQGWECDTWEKAKILIDRSKQGNLLGRSFHPKIWDGSNPLGIEKDVVRIYTGFFYCQEAKNLVFATSSAGASFLTIDDKLVASWPGWHGAVPFVRPHQEGSISLTAGLHRLNYYHIGQPGQEIAVAAVAEGPERKFGVIPEKFFLPVTRVEVGPVEKKNSQLVADFSWENTHYLRRDDWELITFRFQQQCSSSEKLVEYQWDFGDGQVGSGSSVSHTYLAKGQYQVSLKIKDSSGKMDTIQMRIKVIPDPGKMVLPAREVAEYLEEFSSWRLTASSTEDLIRMAGILMSYDSWDLAFNVYRELISRELKAEEKIQVCLIAGKLAVRKKDYPAAEKIYLSFLKKEWSPEVALELGNLFFLKREFDRAASQYQEIISRGEKVPAKIRRKAEVRCADILREKGDFSAARKEYERLTDSKLLEVRNSLHSQNVLVALRNKDFSTALERLEDWAVELPSVKCQGQWSVLYSRACLLKKDYESAWQELDLFQRSGPEKDNPYLIWALALSAEALEGLGQKDKAEEYYQKIISAYPGHPLASMAKEKLKSR